LAGIILDTFRKIRIDLLHRFQFARLRLAFLFLILVYNFTEATFKGVHLVWTLFYLIAIDYPRIRGFQPQVADVVEPAKRDLFEPASVVEPNEEEAGFRRPEGVYPGRNVGI
jgi:hypothetical protein